MACSLFVLDLLKTIVLVLFATIVEICKFFVPVRYRMKSVDGKIILITGAGSGLGASLAVKFAKRKARLVLWDINTDGLLDTMEKCRKYQSASLISTFKVDVASKQQVMDTAEKIKSDIGFVDMLINNAGVVSGKSILELDDQSIRKTFNVNTVSHVWTIQAFLPEMFVRNSGQIVCIASLAANVGIARLADYCASKMAAMGIQESLECEIRVAKKTGVKCLTVCPFFINTGMFDGVKSPCPILPILDLNYASSKIEEAILTNSSILYMPRIAYWLLILKAVLPVSGIKPITDLVKIDQFMDTFRGRK